jgi:hypothetical protein
MALTSVQLTHEVEQAIRSHLTKMREAEMAGYNEKHSISMLALYSEMEKRFSQNVLTTGFFNKIVADMRRAGIAYVDGPWVRLSDGAWTLHSQEQERLLGGGTL